MESTKKIMVDMTPKKSKDELEEEKHKIMTMMTIIPYFTHTHM